MRRLWKTLAEKGLGGLLSPWQVRRMGRARTDVRRDELLAIAQAEADAEQIRSGNKRFTADYQLVEARPEGEAAAEGAQALAAIAQRNLLLGQIRGEVNVAKALLHAEDELATDPHMPPDRTVDDDWLYSWRDLASKVSSEKLQTLWGQVLAGEVRSPGAFSLRTLEFLKTLSQQEASQIEKLGPFVIDGEFVFRDKTALESEIEFGSLLELEDLGIITGIRDSLSTLHKKLPVSEDGRPLRSHNRVLIAMPQATGEKTLKLNIWRLTILGRQLLKLGSFDAREAYLRSVGAEIKRQGCKVMLANWEAVTDSLIRYFDEEEL